MGRLKHMHTVPAGYLRAFRDPSADREEPHVWRYERQCDTPQLLVVGDASVKKNIYTLWTETGPPDLSVETKLLKQGAEDGFPELITLLESRKQPSGWGWRRLSRFMAFQLLRTPRSFQLIRDACASEAGELGRNDPQLIMATLAPKFENYICQMDWLLLSNRSDFAFVTSDNPVTMWANRGTCFEGGVGFCDPDLLVLLPLSPKLCLATVQTPALLASVMKDFASGGEDEGSFLKEYDLSVVCADLMVEGVVRHNKVTVANADRYAYACCNEDRLKAFMTDCFIHRPAPVRRDDRLPIGSPRNAG